MPTTNYAKQFDLPPPSTQYQPYAAHFGTRLCAYCGERATTADAMPNLLYARQRSASMRPFLLIDSCAACRNTLDAMCAAGTQLPSYPKRRYAIVLALREQLRHRRGPPGVVGSTLKRRLQYAMQGLK